MNEEATVDDAGAMDEDEETDSEEEDESEDGDEEMPEAGPSTLPTQPTELSSETQP